MKKFTHLHLHTQYSLLDGACKISELMKYAKEIGQDSIAITDHGTMYGVVEFYKEAKKNGIKPIIGCEVYVAARTRFDKEFEFDKRSSHLILLCKNEIGYKNLINMVSRGFTEGFYSKPRIDIDLLRENSEGIVCLSSCLAGKIPSYIKNGDYESAKQVAIEYKQIFEKDSFYIEIQNHGLEDQKIVYPQLIKLARELDIPLVATNDVHYLKRENSYHQCIAMCIQMNKNINEKDSKFFEGDNFYLKTYDEMLEAIPDCMEAIENTQKIADMCNFNFEFGKYHLPEFIAPDGFSSEEYFKKLCYDGFIERYKKKDDDIWDRLEYEMSIISSMDFIDYFLITHDFISYAKRNNISVGPGRGSAAGSIVAYCLGITDVDPIKYSLYFERFLNPERISMPDIDIDFCYVRRQEVIDYVINKYGVDNVAQIVTFGTMAARAAVRDVGRVLDIQYGDVDKVAKLIPLELNITIDRALETSVDLKNLYNTNTQIKKLINTARDLEGTPRHTSTHAAGIVITKMPIRYYVPLAKNDDAVVTQFTMTTLEELGLLKMDFLGLRTLTVIKDTEVHVNKSDELFSINNIPYNDIETFEMLGKGHTSGIFQLESEGVTNVVIGLKPDSIEDITAIISLYRPGPMQSIPRYIECRNNASKITYAHPMLKDILSVTYGCMVYQEQVMEIFRVMAGYSLGRADMVRRAMSKKKFDALERERKNFIYGGDGIEGAISRGVDEDIAQSIFNDILDFANYAFNKAHAVSYAIISYQTAYLKCHYPCEFMSSLLTSVLYSQSRVSEYIMRCKEMSIDVEFPDINTSLDVFTPNGGSILFGLSAIKNVGKTLVVRIVEERLSSGNFKSFEDFCNRMCDKELNKRALEGLIKGGCFSKLGYNRAQLLRVYDIIFEQICKAKKNIIEGQLSFSLPMDSPEGYEVNIPNIPELANRELLNMEKDVLGFYISGHPMDSYRDVFENSNIKKTSELLNYVVGETYNNITIAGIISSVKLRTTKKNTMMAKIILEDITSSIEVVIFPNSLKNCSAYLKEDSIVIVNGNLELIEDKEPKIICHTLEPLDRDKLSNVDKKRNLGVIDRSLFIKIYDMQDERLYTIKQILLSNKGDVKVKLYLEKTKTLQIAKRDLWVNVTSSLLSDLRNILGEENVLVK